MENRINIAELLKDCPSGMELYSPIYGVGVLTKVTDRIHVKFPKEHNVKCFRLDGKVSENGEVMIFPKGKTTWEGFQRPFKDGDIVATESGSWIGLIRDKSYRSYFTYAALDVDDGKFYTNRTLMLGRLATEEEKQKLFEAIKDNGYRWNAETKTLEKLLEPKFKVGDRVKDKNNFTYTVLSIEGWGYILDDLHRTGIAFGDQDNFELVPNKFDITTLIPFESRVLVREDKTDVWQPAFYGFFNQHNKRFYTTSTTWLMCIPYNEDTKHLIGTPNDCDEYYKTW